MTKQELDKIIQWVEESSYVADESVLIYGLAVYKVTEIDKLIEFLKKEFEDKKEE